MSERIQDVLAHHLVSAQSMYETYLRIGDANGALYVAGKISGLKIATEVADNLEATARKPKYTTYVCGSKDFVMGPLARPEND